MKDQWLRAARRIGMVTCAVFAAGVLVSDPAAGFNGKKGGFGGGPGGAGHMKQKGNDDGGDRWRDIRDPADFYFPGYDANGDGHLDPAEWKNRGNFERLDADGNGTIESREFAAIYYAWRRKGPLTNPIRPSTNPTMDPSIDRDRISYEDLDRRTVCGIVRFGVPGQFKCSKGHEIATELGLFETGIGPTFPKSAFCNNIDEIYGLDYLDKTGAGMHGGIDLPTDFNTPMLAVADGTVVAKFDPRIHARGKTVVLRHSPEDTGLPFWIYTEYGHLDSLPEQAVGQRVRRGEILGPTGNSGVAQKSKSSVVRRRPGIHFAVYYSDSPRFAEVPNSVIPERGLWMDPNALYRGSPPYDSPSLKALPEAEKKIPVPVMFLDGTMEPATTKLIWPYACKRE